MIETRRVYYFVVSSTAVLSLVSLLGMAIDTSWEPLQRINLFSDITQTVPDKQTFPNENRFVDSSIKSNQSAQRQFSQYLIAARITAFQPGNGICALPNFQMRLHVLQKTKKSKLRIAYFGDSIIEGDLITQTIRQLLQARFGGAGAGFVPITSITSKFRQTVRAEYSKGWMDMNLKQNPEKHLLYLSGHAFSSSSDWVRFTDSSSGDSSRTLEKHLLYKGNIDASVQINGREVALPGSGVFQKSCLATDESRSLALTASAKTPLLYGVSFESTYGIILDNFSFRGISGLELAKISPSLLKEVAEKQPYDLIILHYGVNLLYQPMNRNFRPYGNGMLQIVATLKNYFPKSDILIVSSTDRAFRYHGGYASAVGIDSLIHEQARVAYESRSAFYNQFATMGGANSIVKWVNRNPPMANKDYIHPNSKGAAFLGESLYKALIQDFMYYTSSSEASKQEKKSLP